MTVPRVAHASRVTVAGGKVVPAKTVPGAVVASMVMPGRTVVPGV